MTPEQWASVRHPHNLNNPDKAAHPKPGFDYSFALTYYHWLTKRYTQITNPQTKLPFTVAEAKKVAWGRLKQSFHRTPLGNKIPE